MLSPILYAETGSDIDTAVGVQSGAQLKLTQSYPEDKDEHLQVDNSGIKLYFDGNVTDDSVWKNNKNKFRLTTKKGKVVKTTAYKSKKTGNDYILVVVNSGQTLKSNSDYVFTISEGLKSTDGKVFESDKVLNYTTVDLEGNTKINMLLMGAMVVGIIAMTVISNRRKEQKEEKQKEEKVNPYKVAKEKGKSVEEVVEKIEKDKAKKAKKLKGKNDTTQEDEDDSYTYKKDKLRKVADAGSAYKSGRKAIAEKKTEEAEARKSKGTTNPKKKNNSKNRNRKKK
jgi:preprotein translocase subunit SecG